VTFASSPSWWLAAIVAMAVSAALLLAYRRTRVPLSRARRATLIVLRVASISALLVLLMRPVALLPPSTAREAVVPVLVDVSRSMRTADADGQPRIARARAIAQFDLLPALSQRYQTALFAVGDGLAEASLDRIEAKAGKTDLTGALARVRERFRGQRVAGIVLLSDGADTGQPTATDRADRGNSSVPVFAIGVGATSGLRDREVRSIAAGDQRLADASVDLQVSASSSGFGRAPYEMRLLANGALVETRRVSPAANASPDQVRFTVFPDSSRTTVYTAEIPGASGEPIGENNARSVLVSAAGRARRVLLIAGAPGFEPSFMTRAWSLDPGLEVDSVVRKGKNADGRDTFVIQAAAGRAPHLSNGFPSRREDLYLYDALVIADVEGEFFTRAQLTMIADFVGERGGGLLVAGSRSLAQRGLIGTPLEPVLPVELDDRRGGLARASFGSGERSAPNRLVMTPEGEAHPIMRLGASGASLDVARAKWASLPALAALTPLGQARAGASVLAVGAAAAGGLFPVVAVQRYGRGRSMIFGGEASWRWRMLAVSADRSHELFWRQSVRWLAEPSPDPVVVTAPDALEPGDAGTIDVDARDAAFAAVPDARVTATIALEGGNEQLLALRRTNSPGHFSAAFAPDRPGVYRIHAEAAHGATRLGASDRTIYVGGSDREFADPRLNEGFLRRLARESGGRYVRASDASRVLSWLDDSARQNADPERRDLWNRPWALAMIVLLLCAEWTLRRRWGLR
jgi:uncharacterized membrane protein